MDLLILLVVLALTTLIGFKVISEVPPLLHTPLMSGMNALSGITVAGAIVVTAIAVPLRSQMLGAIAVVLATINVVAGFVVTGRMLRMFEEER